MPHSRRLGLSTWPSRNWERVRSEARCVLYGLDVMKGPFIAKFVMKGPFITSRSSRVRPFTVRCSRAGGQAQDRLPVSIPGGGADEDGEARCADDQAGGCAADADCERLVGPRAVPHGEDRVLGW